MTRAMGQVVHGHHGCRWRYFELHGLGGGNCRALRVEAEGFAPLEFEVEAERRSSGSMPGWWSSREAAASRCVRMSSTRHGPELDSWWPKHDPLGSDHGRSGRGPGRCSMQCRRRRLRRPCCPKMAWRSARRRWRRPEPATMSITCDRSTVTVIGRVTLAGQPGNRRSVLALPE